MKKSAHRQTQPVPHLSAPETRISEWVNMASFLWWSLLLLLPRAHLFAVTPSFSALAARGDERQWGVWTLAATVLALVGLRSKRPCWRVLGLAAAAALWTFVSALIAMGAPVLPLLGILLPRSTGVGLYAVLGAASVVCTILLSPYYVADLLMTGGRFLRRPSIARVMRAASRVMHRTRRIRAGVRSRRERPTTLRGKK